MSSSDELVTDAASATRLRVCCSCWPGLIPAATVDAATVAASPIPNAVPFTEARALSMI